MSTAILKLDIQTYWHPGTGRGSGFHLDAVTHEGADGLPRLPGRTLKGLLRDALWRAQSWGWRQVPAGTTEALFGTIATEERHSTPGLLRVSDATLPPDIEGYLATSPEGRRLVPGLYREHFSTAIDPKSGVAEGRSLRGMRVVVPLVLQSSIDEVAGIPPVPDWQARLTAVLPLVDAVGAVRSRGFGRVRLHWAEESQP
jgi:RAMP superfamily